MAEYVPGRDENLGEVAQNLLAHAGDRAGEVQWLPRPDTPHGGVFSMPDDVADGYSGGDRLHTSSADNVGEMRRLATDGSVADPTDATEMNDRIAAGEVQAGAPAGFVADADADESVRRADQPSTQTTLGADGNLSGVIPDGSRSAKATRRASRSDSATTKE